MATYYTNWSFTNSSSPNSATYVIDGQNVTYYNDVRYKFVVTESVNKTENKSTLTVKKYALFYWTWPESGGALDIDMGSKISSASTAWDYKRVSASRSSSGYILVGTDSFTVNHNTDGSGSVSFTGTGKYTGGSGTEYKRSVSKTISLTKIDRPSTVTSDATSTTKFGDTITFSITKKSSSFTSTLTYKMYNASGTIASKISGITKDWQIPIELIASTPDNANPTITITCETFNGNTSQGKTAYNFSCKVPDSYVPTVDFEVQECSDKIFKITSDTNYLINKEYYSKNNTTNLYTLLIAGTDYTVGDAVAANTYDRKVAREVYYDNTQDITYLATKKYYKLQNNNYVLMVAGTDYTVGNTIPIDPETGETTVYEQIIGGFVQGVSQVYGVVDAHGIESSTINSYATYSNDVIYTTPTFKTEVLRYNQDRKIISIVTDSRGRTATINHSYNINEYFVPTITKCWVERGICKLTDDILYQDDKIYYKKVSNKYELMIKGTDYTIGDSITSNTTYEFKPDEEGKYGRAFMIYNIAPLSNRTGTNLNTFSISAKANVSQETVTDYTFIGNSDSIYDNTIMFNTILGNNDFDTASTYTFTFQIIDLFNETILTFEMTPSFITISKRAGGRGITFGRSAATDGFVNYMDTRFYGNTTVKNISVEGLKTEKFAERSWITYVE